MKLIEANREKVVLEMTRKEYRLLSHMSLAVSEEYDVLEKVNLPGTEEEYDYMSDEFSKLDVAITDTFEGEE